MNKKNIVSIHRATKIQCGMLFHTISLPGTGVYTPQHAIELFTEIDIDIFRGAWQKVVDRHGILRTLFINLETEDPLQVELRQQCVPFEYQDWRTETQVLSQEDLEIKFNNSLREQWLAPFNIEQPPLMRLLLIQLDRQRFRFVWTYHHSILDGWSSSIVLKDFFTFYENMLLGMTTPGTSPVPYVSYIRWLKQQDNHNAHAYWENLLKGYIGSKSFASAQVHSDIVPEAGSYHVSTLFPESLSENLRTIAKHYQVTLSTIFQALVGLLLRRYTDEHDFVIGATVSGRPADLPDVETIVGQFINTVPVRIDFASSPLLSSLLQQLQTQYAESNENSFLPLVDIQKIGRRQGIEKLFETLIVFENYPISAIEHRSGGDIHAKHLFSVSQNNFPLSFVVMPGSEIHIMLKFDPACYSHKQVQLLADDLTALAEKIAAVNVQKNNPRVDEILSPSEREIGYVLSLGKSAKVERTYFDFASCFTQLAATYSERTALSYFSHGNLQTLSYGDLERESSQFANFLRSEGLIGGDRVAICLQRSKEFIVSIVACLRSGIAYVPIDLRNPPLRMNRILRVAKVSAIITTATALDKVSEADEEVPILDWVRDAELIDSNSTVFVGEKVSPTLPAYLIFTSGSTGEPKGVVISHSSLMNYVAAIDQRLKLPQDCVMSALSTVGADLAYTSLFGALATGREFRIIGEEKSLNPQLLAEELSQYPIDCLKIVPSHLAALADGDYIDKILPRVCLVFGGEKLSLALVKKLQKRSPQLTIVNHYGPTESTIGVLTQALTESYIAREGQGLSAAIGRPLANCDCFILDQHLNPVPAGRRGHLFVAGESLALGYFAAASATASSFLPHPYAATGERIYATGDIAKFNEWGEIEFCERYDQQVKINGYRVELAEIQAVIASLEDVKDAAILVKNNAKNNEDSNTGNRLHAYVVAEQKYAEKIIQATSDYLPTYMQPHKWYWLAALPLNNNGKLDSNALRAIEDEWLLQNITITAPRNKTEEIVYSVWKSILKNEEFGIFHNFFQLGGDSLSVIRLISKFKDVNISLEFKDIYDAPRVADLAKKIEQKERNSQLASTQGCDQAAYDTGELQTRPVMLTPSQNWLFQDCEYSSESWLQELVFDLAFDLDVDNIKRAIEHIMLAHDVLRYKFYWQPLVDAPAGENPWKATVIPVNPNLAFMLIDAPADCSDSAADFASIREQVKSAINLTTGEGFKIAYIRYANSLANKLYIMVHHAIADMFSIQLMLEDFYRAYDSLSRTNLPPRLNVGATSHDVAVWADRHSPHSQKVFNEVKTWVESLPWSEVAAIPNDFGSAKEANNIASERRYEFHLDSETSRRLIGIGKIQHNLQPMDMLLVALANTMQHWTNKSYCQCVAVDSGRGIYSEFAGLDVSRTVGWLAVGRIVVVRALEVGATARELLEICRELRETPYKGAVVRALDSHNDNCNSRVSNDLVFNYKGIINDKSISDEAVDIKSRPDLVPKNIKEEPENSRSCVLKLDLAIVNGLLEIYLSYSKNIHHDETIKHFANNYLGELTRCLSLFYTATVPLSITGISLVQEEQLRCEELSPD